MSAVLQLDTVSIAGFLPPAPREVEVEFAVFDGDSPNLHSQITNLTESISDEALQFAMGKVMTDLVFLLDYLSVVASVRLEPGAFDEMLSILNDVKGEAHSLVAFMENHAMKLAGLDESLRDTLDCSAYAIKLEVRRIFECELAGLSLNQADQEKCGVLRHAQGILTNCFQQCMINLARVFDDSLTGARLFPDWETKRERSVRLYRDLSELIEFVHAGEKGSVAGLPERLASFREGSMQCLMDKDWYQFEIFSDQINQSMRNGGSPFQLLHRLGCYLETLLGQVQARSELADSVSEPLCIGEQILAY